MLKEIILGIVVGISFLVGTISHRFMGKKDNVIEEISEMVIEKTTGIDIDLTPFTSEKK